MVGQTQKFGDTERQRRKKENRMGKHYLLNLYECSFVHLNDEHFLIDLQGVTVICLLSESHISIHTWPEEGKAACDVYTCGDCNPKIGCDIIIEQLNSSRHTLSYIER
jgi:S-adenosylmethionine decarboxylase